MFTFSVGAIMAQDESDKPFKERSYYKDIFDAKAQKKIARFERKTAKGDKIVDKADGFLRQINDYKKAASASQNEATKENYMKKAAKFDKKSNKLQVKALKKFHAANYGIYDLYRTHIQKVRKEDNEQMAKQGRLLDDQIVTRYNKSLKLRREAETASLKGKVNKLWAADANEMTVLVLQEEAFHLYMAKPIVTNDTIVNPDNSITVVTDTVKVEDTNIVDIFVDPEDNSDMEEDLSVTMVKYHDFKKASFYKSKQEQIIPKFTLNSLSKAELKRIKKLENNADTLYFRGNSMLIGAGKMRAVADTIKDAKLKKQALRNVAKAETEAFVMVIEAMESDIKASDMLYTLYSDNINQLKQTGTPEAVADAEKMEQQALNLYGRTKSKVKLGNNKIYKAEKYPLLEEGYRLGLQVIKNMETACLTLINNKVPIKNELVLVDESKLINILDPEQIKVSKLVKKTTKSSKVSYSLKQTATYSASKPKPVVVKASKGIVFRVQSGIFYKNLAPNSFGSVQPYYSETFKENKYVRILVGNYQTKVAADYALKIVQKKYKDAFVIAYNSGKRQKASKALPLAKKALGASAYTQVEKRELAILKGEKAPVVVTEINEASAFEGLYYTVRVGAFKNNANLKKLAYLKPLIKIKTGNTSYYSVGVYSDRAAADQACEQVKKSGLSDAFVVAYFNGKHVAGKQLSALLTANTAYAKQIPAQVNGVYVKKHTKKQTVKTNKIKFAVQLAIYFKENEKGTDKNLDKARKAGHKIEKVKLFDGKTVYITGGSLQYKQADAVKRQLKAQGVDGFVIAVKGNQKMPLNEARKLAK